MCQATTITTVRYNAISQSACLGAQAMAMAHHHGNFPFGICLCNVLVELEISASTGLFLYPIINDTLLSRQ